MSGVERCCPHLISARGQKLMESRTGEGRRERDREKEDGHRQEICAIDDIVTSP